MHTCPAHPLLQTHSFRARTHAHHTHPHVWYLIPAALCIGTQVFTARTHRAHTPHAYITLTSDAHSHRTHAHVVFISAECKTLPDARTPGAGTHAHLTRTHTSHARTPHTHAHLTRTHLPGTCLRNPRRSPGHQRCARRDPSRSSPPAGNTSSIIAHVLYCCSQHVDLVFALQSVPVLTFVKFFDLQ